MFSAIMTTWHFTQKELAPDIPCWLKLTYVVYIGAVLTFGRYCMPELPERQWMIYMDIGRFVLHVAVVVCWAYFGNILRQNLTSTGDGAFAGECRREINKEKKRKGIY